MFNINDEKNNDLPNMLFALFCYYFVLYVEKKMDKTWMTKSRGTREYRDGCRSFVEFAVSNCRIPNGNIHCPCKSCRNNQRHPPGVVLAHLTGGKGMMTTYTTWFWHGEKHVRGSVAGSYSNRPAVDAASGSTKQSGDMHSMLRDAFGMHKVREDKCEPEVVFREVKKLGGIKNQLKGTLRSTTTSLKSRRSHFMGVLNIAS